MALGGISGESAERKGQGKHNYMQFQYDCYVFSTLWCFGCIFCIEIKRIVHPAHGRFIRWFNFFLQQLVPIDGSEKLVLFDFIDFKHQYEMKNKRIAPTRNFSRCFKIPELNRLSGLRLNSARSKH